jgi:hypothetical protein
MPKSRFTIARVLGLIIILAVFLTGLRSGSNDWFGLIYTVVFLTLIYAAIAAKFRGPFWYGFAVAGWPYFILAFGPWIAGPPGAEPQHVVNRNIVTSVILEIVTGSMYRIDSISFAGGIPPTDSLSIMMSNLRSANRNGICHSGLTLLLACAGGLLARTLARRDRDTEAAA